VGKVQFQHSKTTQKCGGLLHEFIAHAGNIFSVMAQEGFWAGRAKGNAEEQWSQPGHSGVNMVIASGAGLALALRRMGKS